MKLVIAIIQPTRLNAVREALEKIEVTRMTVCDGQGFRRRQGQLELFRGQGARTLLRKVALEIVVNDDFLQRTVETVVHAARTGPAGVLGDDGNVFVLPADQAIAIDDDARGPGAV